MTKEPNSPVFLLISALAGSGFALVGCGDYPVVSAQRAVGNGPHPSGGGGNNPHPSGGDGGALSGGSGGNGELPANTAKLPCEVLGSAGHECVSAHSSVRVIVPGYTGPLYQVEKRGQTLDIGTVDGYADVAAHDDFCGPIGCTFKIFYDQSGYGNHLTIAPPGSIKPTPGNPAPASALPVTINGRSAYGVLIRPGLGYRAACHECEFPKPYPSGVPVGDEPQTLYMVTSQHDIIDGCCFNYGNASVTANNDGNGTMETVYFGYGVIWGKGSGEGPWVMNDMENGVYPGWENGQDRNISTNTPLKHDFVTGIVVGDTRDKNDGKGRFALYGADTTSHETTEMYDGIRPEKPGYVPMRKQGSVILGIGGDNSNSAGGRFYEGVIALDAAEVAVVRELHAAISEAGYGQ